LYWCFFFDLAFEGETMLDIGILAGKAGLNINILQVEAVGDIGILHGEASIDGGSEKAPARNCTRN